MSVRYRSPSTGPKPGALIGALIGPVCCVSCVSWRHSVNAAEAHEPLHRECGMRYHLPRGWSASELRQGPIGSS
jgi:hypothetical protein